MKFKLFSLSAILLLNMSVFGNTTPSTDILQKDFSVTLDWLEQKPKSYAKDFFILQYLNQENLSFENAKIAYEMANSNNTTIKKAFNEKYKKSAPIDLKCYKATIEQLKNEDSKCIALGLTLKEASKLSEKDLNFFISKLDPYPTLKNDLKIFLADNQLNALINSDIDRFLRFFFDLDEDYRLNTFNKRIPAELINKILLDKDFEKFLKYSVFDKRLNNLQKSFYVLKDNKTLDPDLQFLLGINAVNNQDIEIAKSFFTNSLNKSYYRTDRDKALFWLYLVSKDNKFLDEISRSWDNSIYVLYTKELLNIPLDNIVFDIELKNKKSLYDVHDVFEWLEVTEDTKKNLDEVKLAKYSNIFTDEKTLPHMAFVLERFNKYKTQYYITPYKNIIKNYDIYKQILIYSIARQESHFIPSAVSFSSAQGVMQIMPFLSYDISKKLDEDYNVYEQFIPEKNIKYGSIHLDTLMNQFDNNPLFIAYAYNGGAGYTKNQLKKGLFKEKSKYEPFLSMEMISYTETREYGKKVLANYYIYNNHLNKENKISLSTIFRSLVSPY